ncbi:MAG: hypothetical protein C5B48_11765 [Candidatus Rokuibacteriota bacterium]|nr:MAG: hypothetical protein C5B48_11765 [Candidatus Rokubacteria bacterium]
MTRTNLRSLGTVLTACVVGFAVTLVGCASLGPVTPVAVSGIEAVTGTWKGIVYPTSESDPDYVTLTIREDGSYDVVSGRHPIWESSRGKGKIVISEGQMVMEGDRGRGIARLLRDALATSR